jgi:hypothetical protein
MTNVLSGYSWFSFINFLVSMSCQGMWYAHWVILFQDGAQNNGH